MIKIARGIEGIRKIKADNASGWHVIIDGEYGYYFALNFGDFLAGDLEGVIVGIVGDTIHVLTMEEEI